MKIGILTYPNSPSLGASLQMYSLYRVIEQMGHKVEIINYDPPNLHNRLRKPTLSRLGKLKNHIKQQIINILVPRAEPKFAAFEGQLRKKPIVSTTSSEVLADLASYFDFIVVGSDQVWNEQITGHDFNFYLEFCDDPNKKVSYAASFGNDDVLEEEKEKIAKLLSAFKAISVREVRGQEIVESLIGSKPELVLDPTLLISEAQLREQMIPHRKDKYVLFYTIKSSERLRKIAQAFADRHGYKLVFMNGRVKDRFAIGRYPVYGVGPREFLGLVDGAEYVFTNSFHGVAISLAFHKRFYVEFSSDTNSRLRNIVETFDLSQCIVNDQTADCAPVSIDYVSVDRKLAVLRDSSMLFLRGVLKE